MYHPEIDTSTLVAVDTHVHVEVGHDGHPSLPRDLAEAAATYFRTDGTTPDLASIAQFYRQRSMAAVVFTVDAQTQLGHPPIPSEDVLAQASDHADVLIPFASVDPWRPDAIDRVQALVRDHGAQGFKLHPTVQGFDPSDEVHRPFWAALADLGVPVVVHTGQTGIGAGVRGGRGLKLRYSDPMLLDDVAADFPALTLIFAHPSVPWQDEAISIATHKANVAIDLSGWRPKYFPPALVRAADTVLRERVLFGSDFPMIHPDRWLTDFAELPIRPEVRPLVLRDNALRILGLPPHREPELPVDPEPRVEIDRETVEEPA